MTELEHVLPQLATKAGLADIRAELAACATKADLADVRAELAACATKADLADVRAELAACATKADLERYATKADLESGLGGLRTHMLVLHEAVVAEIRRAGELFAGRTDRHEERLNQHERTLDAHTSRIQLLEDVRRIRRK
jgi:hypothetical protein